MLETTRVSGQVRTALLRRPAPVHCGWDRDLEIEMPVLPHRRDLRKLPRRLVTWYHCDARTNVIHQKDDEMTEKNERVTTRVRLDRIDALRESLVARGNPELSNAGVIEAALTLSERVLGDDDLTLASRAIMAEASLKLAVQVTQQQIDVAVTLVKSLYGETLDIQVGGDVGGLGGYWTATRPTTGASFFVREATNGEQIGAVFERGRI